MAHSDVSLFLILEHFRGPFPPLALPLPWWHRRGKHLVGDEKRGERGGQGVQICELGAVAAEGFTPGEFRMLR
jgi:hypothetical protein